MLDLSVADCGAAEWRLAIMSREAASSTQLLSGEGTIKELLLDYLFAVIASVFWITALDCFRSTYAGVHHAFS
jgi:hypothetical protein